MSTPASQAIGRSSVREYAFWVFFSLLTLWGGSLLAADAPHSAKRLVVFHVGCGLLGGLALGMWWRRLVSWPASRLQLLVVAQFVILGLGNMALISYQAYLSEQPDVDRALQVLEGIAQSDPAVELDLEQQRRDLTPTFGKYLQHRVSRLGKLSIPAAGAFWAVELLLAGGLAIVGFRLTSIADATDREPTNRLG
ncbi:MAG: hypothetical protein KDA90_01480 [Planctomycetaceae bacterium]|nr:hypothetical protein [Planctomycetaceae bacterium]